MPNTYAVVPDILPGNVTIGGDLTVNGSSFRLGTQPRKYRIQEIANGDFRETVNLNKLTPAQDDAAVTSTSRRIVASALLHEWAQQAAGAPGVDTLLLDLDAALLRARLAATVDGLLTPTGHIATGAICDGTLTVVGVLTPSGHIATGAICDGTLTVTGLFTPSGHIAAGTQVDGALTVIGLLTPSGHIATGVICDGTLTVTGLFTPSGHIAAGAICDGALTVVGLLTPSGHIATGVICDGTLTVTGLFTPNGNIAGGARVQGNLNVDGPTLKFGTLTRKLRLQEIANGDFRETVNLDKLTPAQDDALVTSTSRRMVASALLHEWAQQAAGTPGTDVLLTQLDAAALRVLLSELRLGSGGPFARLFQNGALDVGLSRNLAGDFVTRDDAGQGGEVLYLSAPAHDLASIRVNAGGNSMTRALPLALFTDYIAHTHTGTVTEDTIYSKLIRGGIMGANGGLLIRLAVNATAQGAGSTTVRVKLGATTLQTFALSAAGFNRLDATLANRGASNSQVYENLLILNTTVLGGAGSGTAAVDTSVDQTLVVTVQNANAADAQTFNSFSVHVLNSFGPV